jgi:tetratricopeptide (TPR) repeat protein
MEYMQEKKAKATTSPEMADHQLEASDANLVAAAEHLRSGNAACANQDLATAEVEFRRAIELKADYREALANLGILLRDGNRLDEAKAIFQKMVDTQPRAPLARNNLGLIAELEGDFEAALGHYRAGIKDAFQAPKIHFNLGMLLLRLGQYQEGWNECEWRWQTAGFQSIRCPQSQWDGSELDGTLLVHTEQGAGDTFQFIRFLPQVRERCKRVLLVCPQPLMCMLADQRGADEVRSAGEFELDEFAAYLPLMSAPFVLQVHDETAIPTDVPYLTPAARQVDLGESHVTGAKLKVGLAWAGSPTHNNDKYRSMHAENLERLLTVPDVAFYSLQKGPQTEQLRQISGDTSSLRDLDELQTDFADTAAIVNQLDLVISVDTSVLHLAGGLNTPTWGLLSALSDWRWQTDREDSPWYPSLRLFRQPTVNAWNELVERVADELSAVVSGAVRL